MRFFKKKRRPKKRREEEPLKLDISLRIEKLKQSLEASGLKVQSDFFTLFKRFFKEFFNIKYSFTYEEFNNEVKKKRELDKQLKDDIIVLSNKLLSVEYGAKHLSKNELNFLITDFETVVSKLLELRKEKKSRFAPQRVFAPFLKIKQRCINAYNERKSKFLKIIAQTKEELRKRNLEHLNEIIAEAQGALRSNDAKKARDTYSEMRKTFDKLPLEDKRANYKKIMNLYDEIVKL